MAKKATKKTRAAKVAQPVRKKAQRKKTTKKPARKTTKHAAKKTKKKASKLITGYDAIGELYEVSARTIQAWVRKGMPTANDSNPRTFHPSKTDPWVEKFRAENPQAGTAEDEHDERRRRNRARREELLADRLQREKDVEEGQLLSLEDYELLATETITAARDRLLRLPKDFKRQLCRKCQPKIAELEEQICITLERLASLHDGPDGKRKHG